MNKGAGAAHGPTTAAAAAAVAQKQNTLMQRVDTDIANIVDNFNYLVNVSRVNDPPVRKSQEAFMMEMLASRMAEKTDRMLARIGKEAAASFKELEAHHFSSLQKINQDHGNE